MKNEWSRKWVSSKQPRKQRKYRHNALLHTRRRFLSAHLSPTLRNRHSRRSFPVRKGDEVMVTAGSMKGKKGLVEKVDLRKGKVYMETMKVKKADGSEVMKPFQPSNLMITAFKLDDKRRGRSLERSAPREAGK